MKEILEWLFNCKITFNSQSDQMPEKHETQAEDNLMYVSLGEAPVREVSQKAKKHKRIRKTNVQKWNELKELQGLKKISLTNKVFLAHVTKVVDGDTLDASFCLDNGKFASERFRVDGVDTPEIRSGETREFGKQVKQIVANMIEGKRVKICGLKDDKYGRPLARILVWQLLSDGTTVELDLSDYLKDNDLAKSYHGKTKEDFKMQDYQQFTKNFNRLEVPCIVDYPLPEDI